MRARPAGSLLVWFSLRMAPDYRCASRHVAARAAGTHRVSVNYACRPMIEQDQTSRLPIPRLVRTPPATTFCALARPTFALNKSGCYICASWILARNMEVPMSSQGWKTVYQVIRQVDRQLGRPKRRPEYSDVLIVAMYLWAAAHDRPQGWACRRESYGSVFRPRALPSESRFSRRLRTARSMALLEGVYRALARTDDPTPVATIDGRPFPVGPCSKDRDARPGRVAGGFARGYRLHQIVTEDQRVLCWSVTALNVSET